MDAKAKVVAEIGPVYTLLWAGTDSVASIVSAHGLKVGDKLVPEAALVQQADAYAECWSDYGELSEKYEQLLTGLEALAGELRQRMSYVDGGLEGSWNKWQHDTYARIESDLRTLTNSAKGNGNG